MKKTLLIILALTAVSSVSIYADTIPRNVRTNTLEGETMSETRIKMTFNNEKVIVRMYDNAASRDFLTLLPLKLILSDYHKTEKISPLPKRLSEQGSPAGNDPDVGDFAYYAPWGNLCIFYRDFGYSSGLIILGRLESGAEILATQQGDFAVTLEKLDSSQ
jgi:hypothetical protein